MKYLSLGLLAVGSIVWAAGQEGQERKDGQAAPKPQREHQLLKQFEGEWDTACRFTMEEGKPPMEAKGRETAKVGLGGFWLIIDGRSEMQGKAAEGPKTFEGHGLLGYDPLKHKYVSAWADSMYPHLMVSEGMADESGKTLTLFGECLDPKTQKMGKAKLVF